MSANVTENKLHPGEELVPGVEAGRAVVAGLADRRLRDLVLHATHQMSQRMTPERVTGQEHDVDEQHDGADADAELLHAGGRVVEPHRQPHVVRQQEEKHDRRVHGIAVDVLEDQRERILAQVALARLTNRARRRIRPERFVVGATIVVTGEAEHTRERQDQQRRRERNEARPPRWTGAEPRMRRIAPQHWRVQG